MVFFSGELTYIFCVLLSRISVYHPRDDYFSFLEVLLETLVCMHFFFERGPLIANGHFAMQIEGFVMIMVNVKQCSICQLLQVGSSCCEEKFGM